LPDSTLFTPRGVGAAEGALPDGYVYVSRWVDETEVSLWTNVDNGGTFIPSGLGGASNRVFVTAADAPYPAGATGTIRIDFAVPESALDGLNRTDLTRVIHYGSGLQNTPIYNTRIWVPNGN